MSRMTIGSDFKSSNQLTTALRTDPPIQAIAILGDGSFRSSRIIATITVATSAMPPPLGTGTRCELLSFGTSSTRCSDAHFLKYATMAHDAIAAAAAMESSFSTYAVGIAPAGASVGLTSGRSDTAAGASAGDSGTHECKSDRTWPLSS